MFCVLSCVYVGVWVVGGWGGGQKVLAGVGEGGGGGGGGQKVLADSTRHNCTTTKTKHNTNVRILCGEYCLGSTADYIWRICSQTQNQ